jgi:hypothetical protein
VADGGQITWETGALTKIRISAISRRATVELLLAITPGPRDANTSGAAV